MKICVYHINFFFFLLVSMTKDFQARPFPIGLCISESKIVQQIPVKTRGFAYIVPGNIKTYIYNSEADYYKGYQDSYFAITTLKGGWDCMRHYEILANGCIPYFIDIDNCDPNTMTFLPKDLIKQAMHLPGVLKGRINRARFNTAKYYEILNKLLEHTRKYLTTRAMAQYVLNTVNYSGNGKILYLSKEAYPDYLRGCILTGLKELLGDRVVDVPKIDYIYKSYEGDIKRLYGKGMSYTKIIEDIPVDRENIEERIKNKEFDIIIYGSVHRGTPFHDQVCEVYEEDKIVYLCGEDIHKCEYFNWPNLFLREFEGN